MRTKFYSILTALTMLIPAFGITVKADDAAPAASSGYYKFHEDFSEYDSTNAWTGTDTSSGWAVGELVNGEPKVIAERADGTKWVCSTLYTGGPEDRRNARVWINESSDTLNMCGWGDWTAMLKLDIADEFEIGEVQRIKFTTQRGQRHQGIAMFMNETSNSYIYFGQSNGEYAGHSNGVKNVPFVRMFMGGSSVALYTDETNAGGFTENDKTLNWDIEIEGTFLRWTATSGNGKKWSGSADIDESYAKDYEYLASFVVMGDPPAAVLNEFTYETGNYYSPEMGEPNEVLYRDVYADAEDVTAEYGLAEGDTHKIYKFKDASVIRRMVCADRFSEVELSEDGVDFDTFDLSATPNQVNTATSKAYRYLRLPKAVSKNFKLFTQVNNGDTLTLRKGKTTDISLYRAGRKMASADWQSSDSNYLEAAASGTLTGKKEGEAQVSLVGEKEEYVINVNIEGPLSDALKAQEEGDNAPMQAYLATQQAILDTLNTAVAAGDIAAVQTFFGTTGANTLNDMDLIDAKPYTELKFRDPMKFRAFASRMLTYTERFNCSGGLDSIKQIGNKFLKELYVGNVEGLSDKDAVISALEGNNDILELNLSDKYYKDRKSDIAENFVNASFTNYADLNNRVSEATVIANIKNTISASFVNELLKDYADTIGYNKTRYNAITNKTAFGNALIAKKATMTNAEAVKNFVNTYTETPAPTTKPSGGGVGGGISGGHKTQYVDTKGDDSKDTKPEEKPATEAVQIFSDIPTNHWCYEAIRYLKAKNSVSGYDDGSFRPDNSVTRAEFIKMLVGVFAPDTEIPEDFATKFTDLSSEAWYYDALAKAEVLGILQGTDGLCNPEGNITRQEMAVITYRMIEKTGKTINRENTIEKFDDESEIAPWADSIVLKMQAGGIINGTDGKFMPNGTATRTMAAQVLYKAVSSFEKPAQTDEGKTE